MVASAYTNAAGNTGQGIQVYNGATGAWLTRSFTGSGGVVITNPDGIDGDVNIDGSGISSVPTDLNNVVAYTDFTELSDTSTFVGYGWTTNGGFDIQSTLTEAGHPGIVDNAGTGSNFVYSGMYNNGSGSLKCVFIGRLDAALESGDRVYIGFTDSTSMSVADPSDGIFFRGTFGDTNWQACTANTSTQTTTDTGVAINTDWKEFKIEVNSEGNSVGFYINGSLVATNTTNLPANGTDLFCIFYCFSIPGGDCLIDAALCVNELGNRY